MGRARSLLVLSALVLLGSQAKALAKGGVIHGTVTQEKGAVVEGALVSLRLGRDSIVGQVSTDAKGKYRFTSVAPRKDYWIVVDRIGLLEGIREWIAVADGDTLQIDFEMKLRPVSLDTLEVGSKKKVWKRFQKPITRSEILEAKGLITAQDLFRTLRPQALTARVEACGHVPLKIFVDSARMDFWMDQDLIEEWRVPPLIRTILPGSRGRSEKQSNLAAAWVALGRIRVEDIVKVEFRDCWEYNKPLQYRNSIWITTRRAKWLGEEEGFW